jgi:hypothetical protein
MNTSCDDGTSGKYFSGDSLHGFVKASGAKTFSDFVAVLRTGARLDISRADFLALDKKDRNKLKQVPFFVPACFKTSPSKRTYDQATVCNLLFIDIDDASDAAPFVKDRGLLYKALWGYNFAAYKTASSTPDSPRMRIVIEADLIPNNMYAKAVETVGALLGLTEVTAESKNPVQPMYLPTLFSDTTDHVVFE